MIPAESWSGLCYTATRRHCVFHTKLRNALNVMQASMELQPSYRNNTNKHQFLDVQSMLKLCTPYMVLRSCSPILTHCKAISRLWTQLVQQSASLRGVSLQRNSSTGRGSQIGLKMHRSCRGLPKILISHGRAYQIGTLLADQDLKHDHQDSHR